MKSYKDFGLKRKLNYNIDTVDKEELVISIPSKLPPIVASERIDLVNTTMSTYNSDEKYSDSP